MGVGAGYVMIESLCSSIHLCVYLLVKSSGQCFSLNSHGTWTLSSQRGLDHTGAVIPVSHCEEDAEPWGAACHTFQEIMDFFFYFKKVKQSRGSRV